MTAEEKEKLLATYHPDYKKEEFEILKIGPNKGEKVPHELADMLQANSRIKPSEIDLNQIDYDVDVLIIGGGGGGASAAMKRDNAGAKVMVVSKAAHGRCKYHVAEGGIQAADKPNDSPAQPLFGRLWRRTLCGQAGTALQTGTLMHRRRYCG